MTRTFLILSLFLFQILLSWCFSRHFDFTDEGLYLYALNNAPTFKSFNLYFHLFHPIGNLFDFHILGWRWLGAIALQLGGAYLMTAASFSGRAESFRKFDLAIIGAILGLTFYTCALVFTPAYNLIISVACMMLLGAIVRLMYSSSFWAPTITASFALLLFLTCRISAPIVMVVPLIIVALLLPQIRKALLCIAGLTLVWIAAFYTWKQTEFEWMLSILAILGRSSHDQLVTSLLESVKTIGGIVLLSMGVRYLFSFLPKPRQNIFFAITCAICAACFAFIVEDEIHRSDLLMGTIYALVFDGARTSADLRGRITILAAGYFSFGMHLGTNGAVAMHALNSSALLMFLAPWILVRKYVPAGLLLIVPIALIQLLTINSKYYREVLTENSLKLSIPDSPLNGIYIRESGYSVLVNLDAIFRQESVRENSTPVFVYADSPGLISALGATALGTPWYVTGYKNIDEFNCRYFSSAIERTEKAIYIETFPISDAMAKCVSKYSRQSEVMRPVGKMQDTRNKMGVLDVKWGYIFRKTEAL